MFSLPAEAQHVEELLRVCRAHAVLAPLPRQPEERGRGFVWQVIILEKPSPFLFRDRRGARHWRLDSEDTGTTINVSTFFPVTTTAAATTTTTTTAAATTTTTE